MVKSRRKTLKGNGLLLSLFLFLTHTYTHTHTHTHTHHWGEERGSNRQNRQRKGEREGKETEAGPRGLWQRGGLKRQDGESGR